ncbi:hypothetical protein GCM10023194_47160 [Planotetraspora phitsanulokensis]|uniref:Uncharacterized protein n=1 Tax=Planotetraspora phitsanulokensis TaxID=575192 RepID=A0A8J3XJG8_9ACTN|nr:hypothetical protein Pph01_81930 [Planotetraspora phitsanulokensis]
MNSPQRRASNTPDSALWAILGKAAWPRCRRGGRRLPSAGLSAGGIVESARGGVDIAKQEMSRVKAHMAKY